MKVGVDIVETPCFKNDIVVLCSDGLSGKISSEEIRDLVYRHDSEAACDKLTALANKRGGEDNITVIVVKITSANGGLAHSWIGRYFRLPAWMAALSGASRKKATK
jgi:protein phosphatase